jgi:hypothetical protein
MMKRNTTNGPCNDQSPAQDPALGGGKLKTTALAASLLIVEAALIVGGFTYLGGPSEVTAESDFAAAVGYPQRIAEIRLIDEKLTNDRLGSVHVYPVEIYVHVPEEEETWLADLVGQYQNEIRAEMTALWRAADPTSLQDPHMEVMTRRIESLLRERFEGDADPEFPRITKVVIVSGTGFRVRG